MPTASHSVSADVRDKQFKFSGHESFACRYAWLPKAAAGIEADPFVFKDIDQAMIEFGVGKNMVRSMRFWVWAAGIADSRPDGGMGLTELGRMLFTGKKALDPYLEDIQTLWLIHWKLSTHVDEPLFAWDYLLNYWQHPEITLSHAVASFQKQADILGKKLAKATLKQHFEVFLHTYVPTRSSKQSVLEENLDSPLAELHLVKRCAKKRVLSEEGESRSEAAYMFQRKAKSDIGENLFLYCIADYWSQLRTDDLTVSFGDLAHGYLSPGQVFKMPEHEIRSRLEGLKDSSNGILTFKESANSQQVHKHMDWSRADLLRQVYSS